MVFKSQGSLIFVPDKKYGIHNVSIVSVPGQKHGNSSEAWRRRQDDRLQHYSPQYQFPNGLTNKLTNFAQQTIGDTSLQLQQQNQQSSCNQIIENINGQGCSSTIEQDKQQSSNNFYRPSVPTKDENRFKFTTFEELINPLRSDHPFELWAPKEVALFEACICRYGKNFDKFIPFIKSKSEKEVIDFYFAWKKTEHYKTWKNKQDKRKVSDNQNDWVFF